MSATPTPQLPFKECGTPDTVWGAAIYGKGFKFTATFPVPLIASKDERAFIAEMHAAMLPVVERLFERRWAQMFAGKRDAEGRLYPDRYEDLWPTTHETPHSAGKWNLTGSELDCQRDMCWHTGKCQGFCYAAREKS